MTNHIPKAIKGSMRLFSAFRPALHAGDYEVTLKQKIEGGNALGSASGTGSRSRPETTIDDEKRYFEITGPRFTLAKTEIHSAFPPPNANGAFSQRLAHIAMKRRTLPWERPARLGDEPGAGQPPWLALVLLTDGEANFQSGKSIEYLKSKLDTNLINQLQIDEQGTVDVLEVTRSVVDAVFPREDELELLCHVRQVHLDDTEAAGSDEDGFMSVILSNRLPQPGMRYSAYLLSLEGRLNELPDPKPPLPDFESPKVYPNHTLEQIWAASAQYSDTDVKPIIPGAAIENPNAGLVNSKKSARLNQSNLSTNWHNPHELDNTNQITKASFASDFMLTDMDFDILDPESEKLYFPVLTSWSFTCEGDGELESLMQNLDNGLLGKDPIDEAQGPAAPMTDTGHTIIDHTLRRGEVTQSWYRSPLVPREIIRRKDQSPYHSADQARRIAEDGREDISEATAFEIGRLLALSDPVFIQYLARWRRHGFRVGRLIKASDLLPGIKTGGPPDEILDSGLIHRFMQLEVFKDVLRDEGQPLGPVINPFDAMWTFDENDASDIATGIGMNGVDKVNDVAGLFGDTITSVDVDPSMVGDPLVIDFGELSENMYENFAAMETTLTDSVQSYMQDSGAEVRQTGSRTVIKTNTNRQNRFVKFLSGLRR